MTLLRFKAYSSKKRLSEKKDLKKIAREAKKDRFNNLESII